MFRQLHQQLEELGEPGKSIIIQEGQYQNGSFARAVVRARKEYRLNIRYLMQWPADDVNRHLTVKYPVSYGAFLEAMELQ